MQWPTQIQEFTYLRTYSRWIDSLSRRETFDESVSRYIGFLLKHRGELIPPKVVKKIEEAMLSLAVVPSMRLFWAAGPAMERDNTVGYNCSYQNIDSIESFSECLYILMCGTGYGFSVAKEFVELLPIVPHMSGGSAGLHIVEDSREGWAESLRHLITCLYQGLDLDIDTSELRPRGARLITMGGRSSGPEPLVRLHQFVREVFQAAQGRQLKTIECHDICNQIAEIVVVGGVRRSSEISLSDLDDEDMSSAKVYPFPLRRSMANNSAVYKHKPSAVEFLREWAALAGSGTGERGIFNLHGVRATAPTRRVAKLIGGTNPCAEISLRSKQFCNLSEVIVRADDDLDSLLEKVETATWMGAIQSTFTYFPYLSKEWKQNCEDERLLGVSLTGQMDNPRVLSPEALRALKSRAIKVGRHASGKLGINMPAAITCGKPSGTTSETVNSSSGMSERHSEYYLRSIRISAIDPMVPMMKEQGVPLSPENGERKKDYKKAMTMHEHGATPAEIANVCRIFDPHKPWSEEMVQTWVASFPVKSPKGSVTRENMTAIDRLEWYKKMKLNWCEHNQSCTISVKESEWFAAGNWVYENWDIVNGVAFLPYHGGSYEQAPFQELTKSEYDCKVTNMPQVDFSQLSKHELEDQTQGSKTYACVGDKCDI